VGNKGRQKPDVRKGKRNLRETQREQERGDAWRTGTHSKQKTKIFSKIGNHKNSHIGHDHSFFPYEWTFTQETQDKISKSMNRNNDDYILIGLSKFEQSMLKKYDIKYGNTFNTTVKDHELMVEKVSSGIKIINHKQLDNVAMAPYENENL
jgi:hypothetical protein